MKITVTEQKHLNALMDLYNTTAVSPTKVTMMKLVRRHKINAQFGTVVKKSKLVSVGEDNKLTWNTIKPNINMARKLIEEEYKYQKKHSKKEAPTETVSPEVNPIAKVTEKRKPKVTTPSDIKDFNKRIESILLQMEDMKRIIQQLEKRPRIAKTSDKAYSLNLFWGLLKIESRG